MPANITQNTGRYWWMMIIAFIAGAGLTLWLSGPYMCDVKIRTDGKATICHPPAHWNNLLQ